MRHTRIKICGITRPDDARAVEAAGCHALGLVLWPGSQRYVTVAQARDIVSVMSPLVCPVGVFVDPDIETVSRVAAATGIRAAQLCGSMKDGPWSELARSLPLIRALHFGNKAPDGAARLLWTTDYLVDNATDDVPGGTGETFDWTRIKSVRDWGRIWLAGGLSADNVRDAVTTVRPYAVDVSSGVESAPGRKSEVSIRAFIEAVHEADHAISSELTESREAQ